MSFTSAVETATALPNTAFGHLCALSPVHHKTSQLTELAGVAAGNVLPAMKHAAEELRCLGVGGSGGGGGPSVRQAAKSANEILRAGNSTSRQISQLHADAMKV